MRRGNPEAVVLSTFNTCAVPLSVQDVLKNMIGTVRDV